VSFQDFLEKSESLFRRKLPTQAPPLRESHIFHLGDDEKIQDVTDEIWPDLKSEMAEIVPLPFPDTTCVSRVPHPDGRLGWVLDRIVELPLGPAQRADFRDRLSSVSAEIQAEVRAKDLPKRAYLIMRVEEENDFIVSWTTFYMGTRNNGFLLSSMPMYDTHDLVYAGGDTPEAKAFVNWAMSESRPVLRQAAMISHPMNYIVKVTPSLTPKEERKVKAGASRPMRKAAHFIVVDHDVLVGMSPSGPRGTHASPVPHHRRGHWKRLAERCKAARELGKLKVWVRPTYVGERVFSDEKHLYEVMLDFNRKSEPVAAGERVS
jgi:hypothetical protein